MARHRWLFPGGRDRGSNQCIACSTCVGWIYVKDVEGYMRRVYFLRRLDKPGHINVPRLPSALGLREPWPRRKPLPKCVGVAIRAHLAGGER